jgi:hypothetical protein
MVNRYGFHNNATSSTLVSEGVTNEFAHNNISNRVKALEIKAIQAARINPDSTGIKDAIDVLNECHSLVSSVLEEPSSVLDETKSPSISGTR